MLSRALSLATVTLLIGCLTAGVARARKSRRRQEPLPDILEHLQRLPQEPAWPVEERAGFVAAGLSAPALHDRHRHGLGALVLPDIQRRDRPAVSEQGSAESRTRRTPSRTRQDGRPDQPDRFGRRQPPAAPAQEASRPDADRAHAARRGRAPGPRREAAGTSRTAPDAAKPADGQAPVQAATDSKSGVRQKQGRRGRPAAEEPPKTEQAPPGDAAKEDDASPDAAKAETAATDPAKTDAAKPILPTDAIKTDAIKPMSTSLQRAGAVRRRRQIRDRQGRCSQGERRQRANAASARSGAAGHAGAAGFRSDRT